MFLEKAEKFRSSFSAAEDLLITSQNVALIKDNLFHVARQALSTLKDLHQQNLIHLDFGLENTGMKEGLDAKNAQFYLIDCDAIEVASGHNVTRECAAAMRTVYAEYLFPVVSEKMSLIDPDMASQVKAKGEQLVAEIEKNKNLSPMEFFSSIGDILRATK